MKKCKQLFKGLFSYRCELEELYAYAYSWEQARVSMCQRLAKKHDVHPATVLGMFKDRNNFSIEVEMEITENNDVA
jgi:hypothetical protein